VTADVTSGTGLTASFTPTSCGNGTVSFSLAYTNTTPCSGTGSSSTSGGFKVVAVDSLTPDIPSGQGGLETGSEPPTYWVCPCAGDITVTASSCPGLTADQLPGCWSFTGGTEIDKLHHKVKKTDLMNGPVTFTVTFGTSTKTVILKTDPAKINYFTVFPSGSCLCDNFSGPSSYDNCGNNLAIDCVDCICGFGANGHFSYRYNGISVGVCRYSGANNVFLYKTTKHNCRILCTWHLTQEPATPTRWTVTKYDCMAGASSMVSRTASTWNSNWARPADELINSGYPANSCENQGTVTTTIHPTWQ
jgi:hypothetical protein